MHVLEPPVILVSIVTSLSITDLLYYYYSYLLIPLNLVLELVQKRESVCCGRSFVILSFVTRMP
jgi:hypothetical protein